MQVINQDILNLPKPETDSVNIIIHQTNCLGVAGGLAGKLFEKYPNAFKIYERNLNLGGTSYYCEGDTYIFNANGQYGVGGVATNYNALAHALGLISGEIDLLMYENAPDQVSIYIPYKIGCGLGGGIWDTVLEILKIFESNLPPVCKVFICKPNWLKE
jgi:hypothetical protein